MALPFLFVTIATLFLPADQQSRFGLEWRSEVGAIAHDQGILVATQFAFTLLSAAPRMTVIMRRNSRGAEIPVPKN